MASSTATENGNAAVAFAKATSATGTPGATTLGVTWSLADYTNIVLLEILPAGAATPVALPDGGAVTDVASVALPGGFSRVNTAGLVAGFANASPSYTASIPLPAGTGCQAGDLIIGAVEVTAGAQPPGYDSGLWPSPVPVSDSVNQEPFTALTVVQLDDNGFLHTVCYQTPQALPDGTNLVIGNTWGGAEPDILVVFDIFRGGRGLAAQGAASNPNVNITYRPAPLLAPALTAVPPPGALVVSLASTDTTSGNPPPLDIFTPGSSWFATGSSGYFNGNNLALGYVSNASGSSTYGQTWQVTRTSGGATIFWGAAATTISFSPAVANTYPRAAAFVNEFFPWPRWSSGTQQGVFS